MKKWIFISVLVCIVIFCLFYFSRDGKNVRNYPSDGTTIVAFGDSLVEGVGASTKGGFVEILSQKTNLPVVNLGVSGNTTADGLKRVDEIFEHDPKVVVLLLGGNDYLRKIPKTETFANLEKIIDKIHEKGGVVLLLGVRGGVLKDNFEDSFKDLAQAKKVAYVPDVLDGIVFDRAFMSDGIHPNQKGYAIIAEKVSPTLESLLK